MNLAYIEFYNEVLIELDSLLTLTETKSIVRENMEKIKQFCLDEYRKMHIDEKIANKLFNNSEVKYLMLSSEIESSKYEKISSMVGSKSQIILE